MVSIRSDQPQEIIFQLLLLHQQLRWRGSALHQQAGNLIRTCKRSGLINGVGFGLSIEIPIHDRNQGEIARSKAAVLQAGETAEAVLVGIETDVASGFAGYKTSDEVASLYESGYLDQATQSREISNYAYQRGAASLLDLLDAERSYRATQLAYRQALAAFMTSVEQINFAVGKKVMQ